MNAWTRILCEEHGLILRAAACLDRLADSASRADEMCILSAAELLEFFEDFADRVHQEKEERHLFPALLASGGEQARVRELLGEHIEERATLSAMRATLEGAAYGDPLSRDRFVADARRLAALQREHAAEEERVLLPLAEELLSAAAGRRVLAGFRATEAELLRRPTAHYVSLVERAEARLAGIVAPS